MTPRRAAGMRLMLAILLLVLVGGVFVAYLWETLNRLMAGFFEPVRLLISLPVLLVFAGLLRIIARLIDGWQRQPDA
jgi:hypothetical protein